MDQQVPELELLSPWELDAELTVPDALKASVRHILKQILIALNQPVAESRMLVRDLHALLPRVHTRKLDIANTRTTLSKQEIASYDRYFQLQHVESDTPALILLRSLVTMLDRYLDLTAQLDNVEQDSLLLQKTGLEEHTRLLARVMDLEPLS